MVESSGRVGRLRLRDWLEAAMAVLTKDGEADLRIDRLCRKIGVTKGSFYSHFQDRADFVGQLVAYWNDEYTRSVIAEVESLRDQPAATRLMALMQCLHEARMAKHDVVFRAWATHDSTVAQGVEKVDRTRFEYVRSIFHDMGFRGADLDLRTRLFLVYHSSIEGMRMPLSGLDADEEIMLRHAFLTRA